MSHVWRPYKCRTIIVASCPLTFIQRQLGPNQVNFISSAIRNKPQSTGRKITVKWETFFHLQPKRNPKEQLGQKRTQYTTLSRNSQQLLVLYACENILEVALEGDGISESVYISDYESFFQMLHRILSGLCP